ncbi:T9SS type B sorting domain-containing protein [Tenacibaculum sp. 190524A05c]|uniref:T9SS type B sorting domain-containing protein n=1 Tax=Tenacibaculum platacis TaxID=3137852 RepID=UPI0032B1DB23
MKRIISLLFLFVYIFTNSQVKLSHNIGDDLIPTTIYACSWGGIKWARKFNLRDFGITNNENFIINSAQIGLFRTGSWDVNIQFNIYKVDSNFPNSFSDADLIGSSQAQSAPYIPNNFPPEIMTINFDTPVIIPNDVEMILVEAFQLHSTASSAIAFAAGTENDNDFSWFKSDNGGCPPDEYTSTIDLGRPDTNFYITVNGQKQTILPFEIINNSVCNGEQSNFNLTNQSEVSSVIWNFDEPSSGTNNVSSNLNATHTYTSNGTYTVTAIVTHTDGTVYTIEKETTIYSVPTVSTNLFLNQCDNDTDGFSLFNLNEIDKQLISNSDNYNISYFESLADAENNNNPIQNTNTYQNQIVSIDTIWARVENTNSCFSTSEIKLTVSTTQIPTSFQKTFYSCDDESNTNDGVASFDFSSVTQEVKNLFPSNQNISISYFENETDALFGTNPIPESNLNNFRNINSPYQQDIYIRVENSLNDECLGFGNYITLITEKVPVANPLTISPECDNDGDGLFPFDTSNIENIIIGSQTNVAISYFDENGNSLPSPLPNPFNTKSQTIKVVVQNSISQASNGKCSSETTIDFIVNTVPSVTKIETQETCDTDFDGIALFDTSQIESKIIGNQSGLIVKYFDEHNVELPSPLPNPFSSHSQSIKVRVENPIYTGCFQETSVEFLVNQKPEFEIESLAILCSNLSSTIDINIQNPTGNYIYQWRNELNEIISNSESITVDEGGIYSVSAFSDKGCQSDIKSITIQESSISSLVKENLEIIDDSDNNSITINTGNIGIGNYEFSLLDNNNNTIYDYQDDPFFEELDGGFYTILIRDKNGCGIQSFEISIISYPKFFTPNGDGMNEVWHIKGLGKSFYTNGIVNIYNRFGILLYTLSMDDSGWDGNYQGNPLPSNDYWFEANLTTPAGNRIIKKGSFSLLRK